MTTDRTAVPIFYRTDKYTAIDQGRQRAFSAGQKVEKRGGKGTEKTKDKWVNWIQLQDNATQETFYVVNTHLLVGAYNKGVNGKNKKRIALYNQQLDTVTALTDQFQSSGSSVYVTCDCNVNYDADADPVATMGDSGLIANWRDLDGSPTLGKKQRLDYVWSNRTPSEPGHRREVGFRPRDGDRHLPAVDGSVGDDDPGQRQHQARDLQHAHRDRPDVEPELPGADPDRTGRQGLEPGPRPGR